jgi:ferric-dicitrate binding protein FerR (iron transport regulator)
MSPAFGDCDELRELLDALCEESISAEQLRRLEEIVLAHPEAEAYYVQYMSLQADLGRHFATLPGAAAQSLRERLGAGATPEPATRAGPAPEPNRSARRRRVLKWSALGITALAAGVLLAVWLVNGPPKNPSTSEQAAERSDDTVAVLLQAPEAVWEESDFPTRPGTPLPPGRLYLKSGFAHIEFYSGATVILEGPADFHLISRSQAYCARGKVRVTVPPTAAGFTVGTPQIDLVDRGTEFGLQVGEGDKTDVHVFQGKVELHGPEPGPARPQMPTRELTTGRGVHLEGAGVESAIRADPGIFRTARYLAKRSEEQAQRRQKDWLAARDTLRKDPALVVYYDFQTKETWSRTLPDVAGDGKQSHDGAIVGCSWGQGRWAGKQGLEFKQVSDRVRLNVPGEFDALTLMAWVRIDALPNRFHSLLMTDGWLEAAPHWHISSEGKLELGVQGYNNKGGAHYYSPEVVTPDRLGEWAHLAVTYDRENGRIVHYVNGRPVSEEELRLDIPLRIGDAEIGNWTVGPRKHTHPIRYFSGCIDEFLLFSRALSEQEIERHYTQGRPPS